MEELFKRGREAIEERADWWATLGVSFSVSDVITRADFVAYAGMCLDHLTSRGGLRVIDSDGAVHTFACATLRGGA